MIFTAQKTYWYQPDINNNLELPESERLAVEIVRPTAEDRGSLMWVEQTPGGKGLPASLRFRHDTPRILSKHVGGIKNLFLEDECGKKRAVATGEELAAESFAGMNALVDKICDEVVSDTLTDAQKKSSGSGLTSCGEGGTSGSLTPPTPTKK